MYSEIKSCRISKSTNLINVLSLGEQCLTGVFPSSKEERVTKGPLDLVWCPDSGLLQLKQSYSASEMYGDNYGYRSGLNQSMVEHLTSKAQMLTKLCKLKDGDVVIDIGSNDATSLQAYPNYTKRIGIDPTAAKFASFYADNIYLIPDFFSGQLLKERLGNISAKVITSIAMFYDLEDPLSFIKDIYDCLSIDGVWHFEQSYMPSMLKTNSYDTICHEHLEFYSLSVVKNMIEACDMKIIDVQMNSINGGSFAVTAAKKDSHYQPNHYLIDWILSQEDKMELFSPKPFREFEDRVFKHRNSLKKLIEDIVDSGKTIFGYGASTKGNVLLQFCGIDSSLLPFIADVNEYKFGKFTPGTHIPIISEREAKAMNPDYFLVLPWHFKSNILNREKEYIKNGGKFLFPLPEIEIF